LLSQKTTDKVGGSLLKGRFKKTHNRTLSSALNGGGKMNEDNFVATAHFGW
jgi:hypothetical protein